jgi:hypothetical protein
MRTTAFAVLALLTALTASAGKIEFIDPAQVVVGGGEQFINIYGTELGDHVLYSGKAGEFDLEISARSERGITAYLPDEIVYAPGRYTIYVRGDLGISGPAYIDVVNPTPHPLVVLVPDPVTAPATSRSGATVRYEAWPYGGSAPNPTIKCTPPSGSVFPIGSTVVNCTASNSAGEQATGQLSVTVYDDGRPTLKIPDRIIVTAENPRGAIVKFEATAFDEIDGDLPVSCTPQSGSEFPIGKTTVECVAVDASFNYAIGTFDVTVENRGFLLLHLPDAVTAEAESGDGARVKFEVWADGTDDPRPEVKCDPESGSQFRVGATSVYCTAKDKFGNSAEGKFDVNVVDTAPPVFARIYAKPDVIELNDKFTPVTVTWDALDVVDPSPRCEITSVWSNDPITPDDYKIVSEREVSLRGATSTNYDRVYHVSVICTDSSQNSSSADANVRVPSGKPQTATVPVTAPPTKKRSTRH